MSWTVSQVLFAAGDVSALSMAAGNGKSESLYRHCIRLTNYSSRYDQALDLSNVKRLGVSPRVGRIGLPGDAPQQAVNVDCTAYYEKLADPASGIAAQDSPNGFMGHPKPFLVLRQPHVYPRSFWGGDWRGPHRHSNAGGRAGWKSRSQKTLIAGIDSRLRPE